MNDVCPICLDFLINGECKNLKCKHVFHIVCIEEWLAIVEECPICRRPVFILKRRVKDYTGAVCEMIFIFIVSVTISILLLFFIYGFVLLFSQEEKVNFKDTYKFIPRTIYGRYR